MRSARADRGFTLIEIMAVVVIIGLMSALVFQNFGRVQVVRLRDAAISFGRTVELTRRQAITTGRPHRVLVDVENGWYVVEWWVSEAEDRGDPVDHRVPEYDTRGMAPIPMAPPLDATVEFRPIPNRFGQEVVLDETLFIEGVETSEGFLESGMVELIFQDDGSTDAAEVILAGEGGARMYVEILPLLENVRIYDEEG